MTKKSTRGGPRPGAGRQPTGRNPQKCSVWVAQGIKELAQAMAKERGLPGWGHLIDELVEKEAIRLGKISKERINLADKMNISKLRAEKFIEGNFFHKQYWMGVRDEAILVLGWLKKEGISPIESPGTSTGTSKGK